MNAPMGSGDPHRPASHSVKRTFLPTASSSQPDLSCSESRPRWVARDHTNWELALRRSAAGAADEDRVCEVTAHRPRTQKERQRNTSFIPSPRTSSKAQEHELAGATKSGERGWGGSTDVVTKRAQRLRDRPGLFSLDAWSQQITSTKQPAELRSDRPRSDQAIDCDSAALRARLLLVARLPQCSGLVVAHGL